MTAQNNETGRLEEEAVGKAKRGRVRNRRPEWKRRGDRGESHWEKHLEGQEDRKSQEQNAVE